MFTEVKGASYYSLSDIHNPSKIKEIGSFQEIYSKLENPQNFEQLEKDTISFRVFESVKDKLAIIVWEIPLKQIIKNGFPIHPREKEYFCEYLGLDPLKTPLEEVANILLDDFKTFICLNKKNGL
jgi:hypothetical protein